MTYTHKTRESGRKACTPVPPSNQKHARFLDETGTASTKLDTKLGQPQLNCQLLSPSFPQRLPLRGPMNTERQRGASACSVTVEKINFPQQNTGLTPTRPAKAGEKLAPMCQSQIRSTLDFCEVS